MGDTNTALGADGEPFHMPVGGKEWLLTPRTKKMEATFSEWVKTQARAEVYSMRAALSREDYAAQLNDLAERAIKGHYAFHRKLCQDMLVSEDGCRYMIKLQLLTCQPKITDEDVVVLFADYGDELAAAVKEANNAGKFVSKA